MMEKGVLLPMFYLPPVEYFAQLLQNKPDVLIDREEHFPKQTYRNRAHIYTPDGVLDLTVPVVKGSKLHTPVKDVRISYDFRWQRLHWMSLQGCYRRSAYFEFYEDQFAPFYENQEKYLFDYNQKLLDLILKLTKISIDLKYTETYEREFPGMKDLRMSIHPKKESQFEQKPYFQVFEDRHGFQKNLSIVDLLFNQGAASHKLPVMAAMKRVRYSAHKKVYGTVGEIPGAIIIPEDAQKPHLTVISYNENDIQISEGEALDVILEQFKRCRRHTHWIQVNGIGDVKLLEDIGGYLKINPLVLEDIANSHQRPKFDDYDEYFFCTSRIMTMNTEGEMTNTQFSALVKKDLIISFEETSTDHFEAVKARLKAGKGPIRTAGPGYLCYALTDTILDMYFVVLAQIGELLDNVEDHVYDKANKTIMYDVQQLKRILIILRRSSWPERDKINDMLRTDTKLIGDTAKVYLRDAYDHCIQIMDMTENYKEIASNILDLYLSMVSNRMNEIMKVLTIISVIFIPLTFIAGIYGMNFARQDPVTNKVMPDNMPELYSPHGYIYALVAMGLIAVAMVIAFWKKGWFSRL